MSGMFSNWISKGAEVITNSAKSLSTNPLSSEATAKQILNHIEMSLSR
jgi:hypothetical protein